MQISLSTLKIIFVATLTLAFAPIMEAQTTFISPNGLYPDNGYQGSANLVHLTDTSGSQIIADDALNNSSESENVLSKADESSVVYGYQVFPNPAKNQVHLAFNDIPLHETSLQIIDQAGRIINTYSLPKGVQQFDFSVSNATSGVYYIRLLSEEKTYTPTKLVISK